MSRSGGGGGIDYSKWDKMDYGDSSSSENENEDEDKVERGDGDGTAIGRPRVTRLDGPSRVTRSADGTIRIDTLDYPTLPPPMPSDWGCGDALVGGGRISEGEGASAREVAEAGRGAGAGAGAGTGGKVSEDPLSEPNGVDAGSDASASASASAVASSPGSSSVAVGGGRGGGTGGGGGGGVGAGAGAGVEIPPRFTRNGGSFVDSDTGSTVYWSQDRYEVVITIPFDPNRISSRDVRVVVEGSLPYSDREAAVGSGSGAGTGGTDNSFGSLLVFARGSCEGRRNGSGKEATTRTKGQDGGRGQGDDGIVLLRGDLPHFVHRSEGDRYGESNDDNDDDEAEWELETINGKAAAAAVETTTTKTTTTREAIKDNAKFVRVTLRKAVPMPGVCIWWDRPLRHCPPIDVGLIKDRNRTAGAAPSLSSSSSSTTTTTLENSTSDRRAAVVNGSRREQVAMMEAWNEAHRMFREKVKSRRREVLNFDEGAADVEK